MWKRPLAATLLTTAGLVLLLTFKTPYVAPTSAANGGNTGSGGNAGSGANVVTAGNGGNGGAAQTAGTVGTSSGQYTGSAVQTPFGTVQVQVTMQNGKITDVQALQLPTGRGHTQQVSAYAGPQLRSEVLQAQSAQVDTISGATYTSQGYIQSLQSALDQAKA
jgi:uncharacterized protein with FMN-binding domain